MAIIFTADSHFGHGNVIGYTNRPYKHWHEMDEALITNWNKVVQPNDSVYHLGDVGLCAPGRLREVLKKLNGKIHLVPGNHDKRTALKIPDAFASVLPPLAELKVEDPDAPKGIRLIVMCHYKMAVWNKKHYGAYHVFGHSHGAIPDNPNEYSTDVGVDCWNYRPISYETLKEHMDKKIVNLTHKRED